MKPEVKFETVTPEIAKGYLKCNIRNRTLKLREIEQIARDIRSGKFITTHQGIAFDESGRLIDGQQRLFAVLKANTPVEMMVTRGLSQSAIDVIDRGTTRTVADIMRIRNKDADEHLKVYENAKIISALTTLICLTYKKTKISTADIEKVIPIFDNGCKTIYNYVICSKAGSGCRSAMFSAALAAMQCGISSEAVVAFFRVFALSDISGCDGYNVNAVLNWRRQLDDAKIKHASVARDKVYAGTQSALWHFANNTDTRVIQTKGIKFDVAEIVKNCMERT